jgi:wyosine [tRNA(Phe)-imidazoG37] synthetase (radical SAM superfamily)
MTLENFGKRFGVTHAAVLTWEKIGNKPAKMNPTTELCIRLFIVEKLNMNNQIFRETFREFDMGSISKASSLKASRPVILSGSHFLKRASMHV